MKTTKKNQAPKVPAPIRMAALAFPDRSPEELARRMDIMVRFYGSDVSVEAGEVVGQIHPLLRRLERLVQEHGPGTGSLLNEYLGLSPEEGTVEDPEFWHHVRGLIYNMRQAEDWIGGKTFELPTFEDVD